MVVVFFFLVETSKLWSFFSWFFPKFPKSSYSSWIFPKLPKLLSFSWFFPKFHGCGLLVLLLVTGQHVHCLIQLLNYLQLSPPYPPPMFSVLIIKGKEGEEGGGG